MKIICIVLFIVILVVLICLVINHIKTERGNKILPKSGAFRQGPDCRHPREYLCIKCGECGRQFIK